MSKMEESLAVVKQKIDDARKDEKESRDGNVEQQHKKKGTFASKLNSNGRNGTSRLMRIDNSILPESKCDASSSRVQQKKNIPSQPPRNGAYVGYPQQHNNGTRRNFKTPNQPWRGRGGYRFQNQQHMMNQAQPMGYGYAGYYMGFVFLPQFFVSMN